MIDKSLRKATAERYGDLIVVHMHGGGDCLWLNMYEQHLLTGMPIEFYLNHQL